MSDCGWQGRNNCIVQDQDTQEPGAADIAGAAGAANRWVPSGGADMAGRTSALERAELQQPRHRTDGGTVQASIMHAGQHQACSRLGMVRGAGRVKTKAVNGPPYSGAKRLQAEASKGLQQVAARGQ